MPYKWMFSLLIFSSLLLSCQNNATTKAPAAEAKKEVAETKTLAASETPTTSQKRVVFFGNSLTAAYGIDPEQGFTALIQKKIDALGLNYKVVNAGNSGETTAGGKSRIDWILREKLDVFVLELGGNDGLRGIEPKTTYENLQSIIEQVKAKYPETKIVLAGMEAPPNMGQDFTQAFRNVFPRLAQENDTALIPFLLEGVGGIAALNLADGIHPTPEGHEIVAENIWEVLKNVL